MTTTNQTTQRRQIAIASVVAMLLLGCGVILFLRRPDPWPARLVIAVRDGGIVEGFTVDGEGMVTRTPQGEITWDLATGKARPRFEPGIIRQRIAADQRSVVGVVCRGLFTHSVLQLDPAGKILARGPDQKGKILAASLVDEGRSLRAITRNLGETVEEVTWDTATGNERRRAIQGPPVGLITSPQGSAYHFLTSLRAVSPDGRILAYHVLSPRGDIQIWDSVTDEPIGGLLAGPPEGVGEVAFTPDGQRLVIGGGTRQLAVWDLTGPRLVRTIEVDPGNLLMGGLTIAADGRTLAGQWMAAARPPSPFLPRLLRDLGSLIGWPGSKIVTARVIVVDLISGRTLARLDGAYDPMITPDGRSLVTREGRWSYSVRDLPPPTRPLNKSGPGERADRPARGSGGSR